MEGSGDESGGGKTLSLAPRLSLFFFSLCFFLVLFKNYLFFPLLLLPSNKPLPVVVTMSTLKVCSRLVQKQQPCAALPLGSERER